MWERNEVGLELDGIMELLQANKELVRQQDTG